MSTFSVARGVTYIDKIVVQATHSENWKYTSQKLITESQHNTLLVLLSAVTLLQYSTVCGGVLYFIPSFPCSCNDFLRNEL